MYRWPCLSMSISRLYIIHKWWLFKLLNAAKTLIQFTAYLLSCWTDKDHEIPHKGSRSLFIFFVSFPPNRVIVKLLTHGMWTRLCYSIMCFIVSLFWPINKFCTALFIGQEPQQKKVKHERHLNRVSPYCDALLWNVDDRGRWMSNK